MPRTCFGVVETVEKFQTLFQPGKDRKLALEWVRAEEQIEHGVVVDFTRLPVSVRHRYLVQIWNWEGERME